MSFEIIEAETKVEPLSIYKKLREIQQKLQAPKDQYNNDAKFSYRSAEDILGAVKPLLDAQGLIITLDDDMVQKGDRYYIKATAKVIDAESGETVETHAWAREETAVTGMRESQITGASSSYARKYAMNGLFAIDDVKDADATNKGIGKTKQAQPVRNTQPVQNPQNGQYGQNTQNAPRQAQATPYQPQPMQAQPQQAAGQQVPYRSQQTAQNTQNQPGSGFQIHKT